MLAALASRRAHPRITVLGLTFALVAASLMAATPLSKASGPARPNVLVILTDDQRLGTLGPMPAVRRWFGRGGRRFPRAVATTPTCCPSRASIFTGRYTHNHGVVSNRHSVELDQDATIQRYLDDRGYRTAYVGKFLNRWPLERDPRHFDRWALFGAGYHDPVVSVDGARPTQESGYATDLVGEYALRFLDSFDQAPGPWFLFVAPRAPHPPPVPEAAYAEAPVPRWHPDRAVGERDLSDKPPHLRDASFTRREARRLRSKQLRTLMSVDDLVDELSARLRRSGEGAETLAIYTSDNGSLWGEHRLGGKGRPYRPSVRVPLFIRWPGRIAPGSRDGRIAANIDIAPTIIDAARIEAPLAKPMDGRSLLGRRRSVVLTERLSGPWRWSALSTKRYQYVEWYRKGRARVRFREYYDWRDDPSELRNLFADGKPRNDPPRRRLHRRLVRLARCRGTGGANPCP